MDTIDYDLSSSEDFEKLFDMSLHKGTITDVDYENNKADVTIEDLEGTPYSDVEIFYHCEDDSTDNGASAFAVDDKVWVINEKGKCNPDSSNLKIVGFQETKKGCGLFMVFRGDANTFVIWNAQSDKAADGVPCPATYAETGEFLAQHTHFGVDSLFSYTSISENWGDWDTYGNTEYDNSDLSVCAPPDDDRNEGIQHIISDSYAKRYGTNIFGDSSYENIGHTQQDETFECLHSDPTKIIVNYTGSREEQYYAGKKWSALNGSEADIKTYYSWVWNYSQISYAEWHGWETPFSASCTITSTKSWTFISDIFGEEVIENPYFSDTETGFDPDYTASCPDLPPGPVDEAKFEETLEGKYCSDPEIIAYIATRYDNNLAKTVVSAHLAMSDSNQNPLNIAENAALTAELQSLYDTCNNVEFFGSLFYK